MRLFTLLILITITNLNAKEDSLKTYELGDIISSGKNVKNIKSTTIKKVYKFELENSNATSLSEMETLIPSANIVTNSRGESLIYLRGASDRQTGVFLNGALLNIPWDNRMDLSLIPSNIVGSINVSNSAGSILYGANSMGGALNITTEEYSSIGTSADLNYQFTEGNSHQSSATLKSKYDNYNFIFNVNYTDNQNFLISDALKDSLLYNNNRSILRNTDLNRFSWFSSVGYNFGKERKSEIGLSYFAYLSEKGISPEHNIQDPQNARFWRYDDILRNMLILNGRIDLDKSNLTFAYWLDGFKQDIVDFTNQNYNQVNEIEEQTDLTFGMRNKYEYQISKKSLLSLFLIASTSNHTNNDTIEFQQELLTVGSEYSTRLNDYAFTSGLAYDLVSYSKTGEFTDSKGRSISNFSYNLGVKKFLKGNSSLFLNHSRKTRFPTMREQFDGALGRFQVNPDLDAETAYNIELGTNLNGYTLRYNLTAALFASKFDDLIVRRTIPETDLRTRENLNEAIVYGLEINGRIFPLSFLDVEAQFTYMFSQGSNEERAIELEYKPNLKGLVRVNYNYNSQFKLITELDHEGRQFGINEANDGEIDQLDASTLINFKINYSYYSTNVGIACIIYLRLNNLSNEIRWNKFGIPDAGRRLITGVNFKL